MQERIAKAAAITAGETAWRGPKNRSLPLAGDTLVQVAPGMTFPALDPETALPYENEIARLSAQLEREDISDQSRDLYENSRAKVQEELEAERLRRTLAGSLGTCTGGTNTRRPEARSGNCRQSPPSAAAGG